LPDTAQQLHADRGLVGAALAGAEDAGSVSRRLRPATAGQVGDPEQDPPDLVTTCVELRQLGGLQARITEVGLSPLGPLPQVLTKRGRLLLDLLRIEVL